MIHTKTNLQDRSHKHRVATTPCPFDSIVGSMYSTAIHLRSRGPPKVSLARTAWAEAGNGGGFRQVMELRCLFVVVLCILAYELPATDELRTNVLSEGMEAIILSPFSSTYGIRVCVCESWSLRMLGIAAGEKPDCESTFSASWTVFFPD